MKILPADKGRSTVVMDSDEYKEKVAVLLNDTKTYLKLTVKRLNPTTSVEKDLSKILLTIKNGNLAQIYTENYTAVIQRQHLFTVFRKFTNLEGHCDPSLAVSAARLMRSPNI